MQTRALPPAETLTSINPFLESNPADTCNAVAVGLTTLQVMTAADFDMFDKQEQLGLFYILGCMGAALEYHGKTMGVKS